jgi:hypothetical protein
MFPQSIERPKTLAPPRARAARRGRETPLRDPTSAPNQAKAAIRGTSTPVRSCAFARPSTEADGGTRTRDPFITSEVLYQLSYVGTAGADGSGEEGGVATRHEGRLALDRKAR